MSAFASDVAHAVRSFRRTPGFALTAISVLALGIGATTGVFSIISAVLLKPLPFPEPDRLVQVMISIEGRPANIASVPKFIVWRGLSSVFEDVSAYDHASPGMNLMGGEKPEHVKGIRVSHDYFRLFGAVPILGRTISPDEDRPGGRRTVVLSNGLWRRRFGGDPLVIGKPLRIGEGTYTIVGVIGPEFRPEPPAELWIPLQADPNSIDQAHYFWVTARLKPGVTIEAANAVLAAAAQRYRDKFPKAMGPRDSFVSQPLLETMVGSVLPTLVILFGSVFLVLLIACANIANLQLVRALGRGHEIAIRSALGASRTRIVRQLLVENLLLSSIAAAAGLPMGVLGVRALLALSPVEIPRLASGLQFDWRIAAFLGGITVFTSVLFGLTPALSITRPNLSSVLRESGPRAGSGLSQSRTRRLLVAAEVALAVILLVEAGLLTKTFAALRRVPPGFDSRNTLAMETSLDGSALTDARSLFQLQRAVIERIAAIPGVEAATLASCVPLEPKAGLNFILEGRWRNGEPVKGSAIWQHASPRYFDVFRIRVLRGRSFTDQDGPASPGVALINQSMAKRYWPHESALGQRIRLAKAVGPYSYEPSREVVGVVEDVRDYGMNREPGDIVYTPLAQVDGEVIELNSRLTPMTWAVRTRTEPQLYARAIEREIQKVSGLPVTNIRSMEAVRVQSTSREEFNMGLLTIFAGLALLLAAVGIYGVVLCSVQQQRFEFGIRMALGSTPGGVLRLVVRQTTVTALSGIGVGLALAFGLTRFMRKLLYGVEPFDPVVFCAVTAVLALVALLASYVPARLVTRIDPTSALRCE